MQSIILVSLCFLPMWLAERVWPGRRWPVRPLWIVRALAFNSAQVLVVVLGTLTWDRLLPGLTLWSIADAGLFGGALMGYLAITFVYYWWHRARHQLPFLWRMLHQVHHSPQRLELLTAFYKHPFEIVTNGVLSAAILYLLVGATPAQAGIAVLMTGVAELFYHWNIKTPYWLGFIIQRPESHCVHHARGAHTYNFSDLPAWDMLFGTFRNPREAEFNCGFGGNRELRLGSLMLGRSVNDGGRVDAR